MSPLMPPSDRDLLCATVEAVLEGLAFTTVRPCAGDFAGWQDPTLCWTEIVLIAPRSDHMILALPQALALRLADDAWGGLSPHAAEAAMRDFLGELGNIVAGQVLARQHPGAEVILGLPTTGTGALPAPPPRHQLTFEVEGLSLCLALKNAA